MGERQAVKCLIAATALLLCAASAKAEIKAPLHINSEEEAAVYSKLSQGSLAEAKRSPVAFPEGTEVPLSAELRRVPATASRKLSTYLYAVHSSRVYIVDPQTRAVVRVIPSR